MIKCLRARRGNVHRKQNCFRGVLLFKTPFAEFCVKSVCKTEPWNWAVTLLFEKLDGLRGSPKWLNLQGIKKLTQKNLKSDPKAKIKYLFMIWFNYRIFNTRITSSSGSIGWSGSCRFNVKSRRKCSIC